MTGVPEFADGTERPLDPGFVLLQRLRGLIATAVIALGLLIALAITTPLAGWSKPTLVLALLAGWSALVVGLGAWTWFWPQLEYRYIAWRLGEAGLEIRRGVVWREVVSVPRTRVQHTDVTHGPIERSFGLATLVVFTAGTTHASVTLGGLTRDVGEQIRDYLIAGGSGRDDV